MDKTTRIMAALGVALVLGAAGPAELAVGERSCGSVGPWKLVGSWSQADSAPVFDGCYIETEQGGVALRIWQSPHMLSLVARLPRPGGLPARVDGSFRIDMREYPASYAWDSDGAWVHARVMGPAGGALRGAATITLAPAGQTQVFLLGDMTAPMRALALCVAGEGVLKSP